MAREQPRRRISGLEAVGLALLAAAVIENRYRRRSAALAMGAYRMRRRARLAVEEPGAGTALLGRALLNWSAGKKSTKPRAQ